MASSNRTSAIFLISLVFFAAANPLTHATIILNPLNGLSVTGQVCCTANGNCPGPPVQNVTVILNCTTLLGAKVALGQATTSANGSFNITVARVAGLLLGLPTVPCLVTVRLPLNSTVCPVLSTANGVLVSTLQSVGTLVTALFGLVQRFILTGFFQLAI